MRSAARPTFRWASKLAPRHGRPRRPLTTAADRAKIETLPFRLSREQAIASMLGVVTGAKFSSHLRGVEMGSVLRILSGLWALVRAIAQRNVSGHFALVSCRAVLIPVWRVDIAARWLASPAFLAGVKLRHDAMDDSPMGRFARLMTVTTRAPVNVRTSCFVLPGHAWSPLNKLLLHLPFEEDSELSLEPYNSMKHGRTQEGEDIGVIPFSHSPFGLLDRVADFVRSEAPSSDALRQGGKHDVQAYLEGSGPLPGPLANAAADEADAEEVDGESESVTVPMLQRLVRRMRPLDFECPLVAAAPLYIPAYLGEFRERSEPQRSTSADVESMSESDGDGLRVTAIALAHTPEVRVRGLGQGMRNVYSSTAFCTEGRWQPRTSPVPSIIAGVPHKPSDDFDMLFSGAMTIAADYMDPVDGLSHPRALKFSQHHDANIAFAEQEQALSSPLSGTAEVEDDEDEDAFELAQAELKEKVDAITPEWLRELNRAHS